MPADYDEMLTFVRMIARLTPVTIDASDDQLESNTATLNRLIDKARKLADGSDPQYPNTHDDDIVGTVDLTARERDCIIAALRLWQQTPEETLSDELKTIATNGDEHEPLYDDEVDILIQDKLNLANEDE